MSELKLLKELQKTNKKISDLEAIILYLPRWIALKTIKKELPCSRQALYKRVVCSGQYEPDKDWKKDGRDIYVAMPIAIQLKAYYAA